jgi:hypothetical protein
MVALIGKFWGEKVPPKEIKTHPKLGIHIEWQFEVGGKHYYKCLNDYEIPTLRFRFATKFYQEMANKVTHDELRNLCKMMKEYLNGGVKGEIKIGEAYKLVDDLEYQLDWAFEPESLLRLASVIYFDLGENISDYDSSYNKEKIATFKKKAVFTYLVKKLMSGSAILANLSTKDLDTYLSEMLEEKEKLSFTEGEKKGRLSRSMKTTSTSSTQRVTKN